VWVVGWGGGGGGGVGGGGGGTVTASIILNFRDGDEWATARHDRFTPGKSPPIHNDQMTGWFPETAWALYENSLSLIPGMKSRFLDPSSGSLIIIPAATSEDIYCPELDGAPYRGGEGCEMAWSIVFWTSRVQMSTPRPSVRAEVLRGYPESEPNQVTA